jgi:transcriptional repressor NrdR
MFCINCFHKSTSVANSRPNKKQPQVWRRRTCSNCHTTFTTYERPSLADNKPITVLDGSTDTFNLGRLVLSIAKAFTHSPNDAKYHTLWLAQTVEDTLSTERQTITPEDIAATAHQVLKKFDELAAVQYAAQHHLISSTRKRGRPSLREHGPRTRESPSR